MPRFIFAFLFVAPFLLSGCTDDYGEACDLPASNAINIFCSDQSTSGGASSSATCVYTNSTRCDSRMCARYIGSNDFCTIECDPADENSCPADSTCQSIPSTAISFCVPNTVAESVE